MNCVAQNSFARQSGIPHLLLSRIRIAFYLALCVPMAASGQGLLSDPGFESGVFVTGGIGGWDPDPFGYTGFTPFVHRSGSRSMQASYSEYTSATVFQQVTVTPGLSYVCSAWARTSVPLANMVYAILQVDFYNASGFPIISGHGSASLDSGMPVNTWAALSFTITAPANAAYAQIAIGAASQAPTRGTMYFDDAAFSIVPEPSSAALSMIALASWACLYGKHAIGHGRSAVGAQYL